MAELVTTTLPTSEQAGLQHVEGRLSEVYYTLQENVVRRSEKMYIGKRGASHVRSWPFAARFGSGLGSGLRLGLRVGLGLW